MAVPICISLYVWYILWTTLTIIGQSERNKLFMSKRATMSKARAPKRKEEYTSPSNIEVICDDILEKGTLLETMSGMKFSDAKRVGNAMAQLLDVIERYKLVGKWVSSVTIKEIHKVSTFMHSLSSLLR